MTRTLIKGGWVVSMDDAIGDIRGGDVLIDGDQIVEVGRGIEAGAAEVIEAANFIVSPGMINMHMHTWQTGLRGVIADWTMMEYGQLMHATAVPHFTPEDVYLADLAGALEQIHAGTTTLFDWHHCNATSITPTPPSTASSRPASAPSTATARPRLRPSRASRRSPKSPIRATGSSACATAACRPTMG